MSTTSLIIFNNFVNEIGPVGIPLQDDLYMWCNYREHQSFVHFDRFLFSPEFILAFPSLSQTMLDKSISDHNAVLLCEDMKNLGFKPFKCFNYWFEEANFDQTVVDSIKFLKQANSRVRTDCLLRGAKVAIQKWSHGVNKNFRANIINMEQRLTTLEADLQENGYHPNVLNDIKCTRTALWKEYRKEERACCQKSRVKWISNSD
ncbi:uncharacterized protein LOC120207618 [Hibiscus syriacus]|uniref:uncharacterized protein LOC120207618 n=1 Tax=Hibiscus syriacus TaxID=106335 RepID=UPI001924B528|nr:uncharacterized protein LOC120207618 [Hibiscus syriacus]